MSTSNGTKPLGTPSEYFFHETSINNYANRFIQSGSIDEAIDLMKLHIAVFPESSSAYDVLGDAYTAKGEHTSAVKSLRKSLALDPNNKNAKEKLKKLEAAKIK